MRPRRTEGTETTEGGVREEEGGGREGGENKHADRTGYSEGEANTANGRRARFPLRSPSSPVLGRREGSREENLGGKRIKDIRNGISWRSVRFARGKEGGRGIAGAAGTL